MVTKDVNKCYIRQYWQRYNGFADGKITQYLHQIAYIYIVEPKQKLKNTYLEAK